MNHDTDDLLPHDRFQRLLDKVTLGAGRVAGPLRDQLERAFVHAASHPSMSHLTGHLSDLPLPQAALRPVIDAYIRAYGVDMSEVETPPGGFRTFNQFFTRPLRAGARPVDPDPGAIVSPADSRLSEQGRIPISGLLDQIKGKRYRLGRLLGDEGEAGQWREGVYATLYLSPRDYHRVHSPVSGAITGWRHIPGRLFPVNGLAVRHVEGLFTVNERVVVHIDSRELGPVAVVLVGAANVGRITLSFTDKPSKWDPKRTTEHRPDGPLAIERGDELGMFNLGSTVVLLASDPALEPAGVFEGEHIKMGQALWRKPST